MHGEAPIKTTDAPAGLRSARSLAANKEHGTRIKYLGGCRCVPCRAAASRYESEWSKKRKLGLGNGLVETQPVIDHLRHLSAQGVGYKAVCEAAGVGKSSIMKIMLGRRTQMRAANARAILAVTPEMAIRDGAVISAKATWRHIRWLLSEGMTREEIARRLGYKAKRPSLQIGKHTVRASTAMKVEQLVGRMRIGE